MESSDKELEPIIEEPNFVEERNSECFQQSIQADSIVDQSVNHYSTKLLKGK
jgi:hypothetical protein